MCAIGLEAGSISMLTLLGATAGSGQCGATDLACQKRTFHQKSIATLFLIMIDREHEFLMRPAGTGSSGVNQKICRDRPGSKTSAGSRGFWVRDGQLLALASHFNAPGYPGEGLSLEAFRWNRTTDAWQPHGTVLDDTLNNFPPKRLPSGQYMTTRRDHRRQVSVIIGGNEAFDNWQIRPMSTYGGQQGRPEEPYWYVLPDGRNIVGLIRDNGGSKRLLRTFSRDNGESWSPIVTTNFPDATSKFFVLRTSRGYYAMVSNSNPDRRDPLTLAISEDGLIFDHLFYLVGGRHVDYPHMIECDGQLLIAFSGAKQTMEVLNVSLDDIDHLIAQAPRH